MNTNAEQFFIDPVQKEMEVAYVTKFRTIPLYDEVTRESIFKCLYWLEKLVTLDKKEGVKRESFYIKFLSSPKNKQKDKMEENKKHK